MGINFHTTKEDAALIHQIVKEAEVQRIIKLHDDYLHISIVLSSVHCNGTELDLIGLKDSGSADLKFDIEGIRDNIDYENGRLKDGFTPRNKRIAMIK